MSTNPYFTPTTELADLGSARFDHDTAAIGDKDYALTRSCNPVTVQAGRAPKGLESQVFAWNTFQFTTEDRNEKEEKKGDLHEGQLHRANRVAAGQAVGGGFENGRVANGGGGRGGKGGRASAGRVETGRGTMDALVAGRKPEGVPVPPLAKGFAEELDKNMFWEEPIC